MNRLVLLCVESNKTARTDYIYVNETIKRFYQRDRKTTIRPVFLAGKTNYNSKSVKKQISDQSNGYLGEIIVIYFIDTDNYDTSYDDKMKYDEIAKYCDENNYELVFFCRDVEEVFLGSRVTKDEKTKSAMKFVSSKGIEKVNQNNLAQKQKKKCFSNIMIVLDKYFERSM